MFNKIFRKEITKRALELASAIVEVREYNARSAAYHSFCDSLDIVMWDRDEYLASRLVDRKGEDVLEYFPAHKNEEEVIYKFFNY